MRRLLVAYRVFWSSVTLQTDHLGRYRVVSNFRL